MKNHCKENLMDIKRLLEAIAIEDYSKSLPLLSGSSLGQHVRHILELYSSVISGLEYGIVNYDNRKRDKIIETDSQAAIRNLESLIEKLDTVNEDAPMVLEGDFDTESQQLVKISTSLYRELAYNLEHSIHHQALIKIGCIDLGISHLINKDFGVAPATLRFRRNQMTDTI